MFVKMVTRSLTGASDSRIGDNSANVFSDRGDHLVWSQPIGMNTKPRRFTGLAAVFSNAVAAGIIASRSGRAIVAPTVFRNVRRGSAFLVIIMVLTFSFGTACCL